MSLTITPELEARLRAKAAQENRNADTMAEALLTMALDWEALEYAEAVEGIRRGLEASDARRVRPLEQVMAEMRLKYPSKATLNSRLAVLDAIDERSRDLHPRPDVTDYLRVARTGAMFGE